MRLDGPLLAEGAGLARLVAVVLESRVRLRPDPRAAVPSFAMPPNRASKTLLGPGGWRVEAFGVVAGDQIARAAARARLQVGEIGLHARDLAIDLAALRRRI